MSTLVSDRSEQPARQRTRKPATETSANPALPCRVRLEDGRIFSASLPAARHRALQLGMLHTDSNGLVELAAGRREDGKLRIVTRPRPPRTRPDHFLPGGSSGKEGWLAGLLALAERHAKRGEEVFFAPAVRSQPRPDKHAVSHTHTLWVDVDRPGSYPGCGRSSPNDRATCWPQAGAAAARTRTGACDEPLDATRVDERTGELSSRSSARTCGSSITSASMTNGKPNVGDTQCAERSRVMRLVGTINNKTGQYARILEADFALPSYAVRELVGDLPDPAPPRPRARDTAIGAARRAITRTPTKRSRRPCTSRSWRASTSRRAAAWCPAPHTTTGTRRARSAPGPNRGGGAIRTAAAPAGRSTTWRRCWWRPDRAAAARRGVQARAGLRPGRVRGADMSAPPNTRQLVEPPRERYVRLLLDKLEAQSGADAALCDRIERALNLPAAQRRGQPVDPQPRRLRVADVIEVVARRYDLDPVALSGPSREQPIVTARHLAMRLARELTGKSYPEIGRAFNRDHST